jgi:peptidoglycan/LPS O-acetylase OafA/YrhL
MLTGERRRLGYRPALDGVRAIAIAAVVGFHSVEHPSGGFLGVHIFFVLSGFLITTLLLEEWDSRGAISLRHFYRRRALRLLPALALALVGFAIVATFLIATGRADRFLTVGSAVKGAVFGAFYISNVAQAAGTTLPGSIGHLWSLATEEQFYVLWPIALVVALRAGISRRALGAGLVGAIAVLAGHRLEMAVRGVPQQRMYFGPDGTFDLLLVGCLAGVVLTSADDATRARLARILRVVWVPAAGVVAAMLLRSHIWDRSVYEGLLLVFGLAVACLLLTAVLDERSLLARALSFGPLVYVGKISYGVYLWHQIVLAGGLIPFSIGFYLRGAVGIAVTVGIASLSYRFVEQPFLRRKRRDRVELEQASVPATAAVATP